MNNLKAKIKEFKKKKFPSTKAKYLEGIPSWIAGNVTYIFLDTENSELEMINFVNEASLPMSRVRAIKPVTEKEVEEYEKNRIGSGLVTAALVGPVAGILVGLNKKNKKKTTYSTFLSILYEDKEGNEKSIVFQTPSPTNTAIYFNKFMKAISPYLTSKEQSGKVEL